MTVLEAIQKSADFLNRKGIESPRLQTELLLAHLLKLPRMKLYLNFERVLTPVETDAMRELIKRRATHEPLQHIVGSTSFCGFEIAVSRHVLVPRPETELLAEEGWKFLNDLAGGRVPGAPDQTENGSTVSQRSTLRVLDFGTGSGCIAIALAAKAPASRITAIDVSPGALALAKENAVKNGVADRIEFIQSDGFAVFQSEARAPQDRGQTGESVSPRSTLRIFDLIISNPPYIPRAEIGTLQPEVRDFDPRPALDGGDDGLDFYRRLAAGGKAFLKPEGKIMLEFGDGQAEAVRQIFEGEKWIVEAVKDDYSQRARILIAKI